MRVLLLPPFVFLMLAGLMWAAHVCAPLGLWLPRPLNWAGLGLIALGLGLAQWHARLFRRIGTNINTFGEPDRLTTEGLFRRSRNPMYLGLLIALLGLALTLGSLSPLFGPLSFFALAQCWYIPLEERAMAAKFGAEYARYRQAVRRWC
ncbi:methyltransferase family protein [Paucibacter sp. M5-1]|uniref:methyltransferase family protein n=1 Tax=Paucibacter sp. M5-1 TaxID=3015998 RepID=UPI0022B93EBB|nr:methyltransferase [Paucibacter sp. M5-1]MCZ7882012.1 methyltransferase [Paucibacter sp. M5-1]